MSIYKGITLVAGGGGCPFPVGSIMFMATNAEPATSFPGTTWVKLEDGRFLRNQTDSTKLGNTGGTDELIALNGAGWKSGYGSDGNFLIFESAGQFQNTRDNSADFVVGGGSAGLGWGTKSETGFYGRASRVIQRDKIVSTESDKNKINPKYIDVAMWKRTA